MSRNSMLTGLNYNDIDWSDTQRCEICASANMVSSPVPIKVDRDPGEAFIRGSVDLYGPVSTPSVGGNSYALIYCDDHNSFGMIEFIADKSMESITDVIQKWKLTARDYGYEIRQLQFDSDSIFENEELQLWLRKRNITSRFAPPGVHQSNGLVERMIRTVVQMARAMLIGSGLPNKFWTYAMSYALLIYNSTMKGRFKNKNVFKFTSPYYMLTKKFAVYNFPIFGCSCIGKGPGAGTLSPWEPRGRKSVFLGFDSEHHDSYIYLSLVSSKIIVSKQVIIFEDYYGNTGISTDYYRLDPTMKNIQRKLTSRSFNCREDLAVKEDDEDEPYWHKDQPPDYFDIMSFTVNETLIAIEDVR